MSMSVHVIPTTKLTIYFRQCLAIDTSALGSHSTDLQCAKVLERSNALRCKFEAWTEVQQFYIPSVTMFRARTEMSNVPQAVQELDLYLPSLIADGVTCNEWLLNAEFTLRIAQAEEVLNDLRSQILLRGHLIKSKKRHCSGQHLLTRSRSLISRIQDKIEASANRYRSIRAALVKLGPHVNEFHWLNVLKELRDEDTIGLTTDDVGGSEGRRKLSWIWRIHGVAGEEVDETTQNGNFIFINGSLFWVLNLLVSSPSRVVQGESTRTSLAGRMPSFARGDASYPGLLQVGCKPLEIAC